MIGIKSSSRIKHTNGREHPMNMQLMLPRSPGHLIQLTKGPIFIPIILSEIRVLLRVPSGPLSAVSDFQLLVQIGAEH